MNTALKKKDVFDRTLAALNKAASEDTVRMIIADKIGISELLNISSKTDGVWNSILFEFKFDKNFKSGAKWHKCSYGTLAQAIYYCKHIQDLEVSGVSQIPHTLVICDKNGGFLFPTEIVSFLLRIQTEDQLDWLDIKKDEILFKELSLLVNDPSFSWDVPPSSHNEAMVRLLMNLDLLKEIAYFDFSVSGHFDLFINRVRSPNNINPKISITQQNFISIFDKWFELFATRDCSRRAWADRFIIDLRKQYKLNEATGELLFKGDKWKTSVDRYESFWNLFIRPPSSSVNEFIATNKDLLYDDKDQNNFGDFYTPLKLVSVAQNYTNRYLDKNKSRVWWDPAAGGGNLFYRSSVHGDLILSTKFSNDVHGLNSNPSMKAKKIVKLDFVHDQLEKDLLFQTEWKSIRAIIDSKDELVFFMNPPFDDQAESGGTNQSLPNDFINHQDLDKISNRDMRSLHLRFFYRMLAIARILQKPVFVASFSTTAWMVGPDSSKFFNLWKNNFEFKGGFIVSSKIFNNIKTEWPVAFTIWKSSVSSTQELSKISLDVFDKKLRWLGIKDFLPFNSKSIYLSATAKRDRGFFGPRDKFETVPPLKNEYEICNSSKVYPLRLVVLTT